MKFKLLLTLLLGLFLIVTIVYMVFTFGTLDKHNSTIKLGTTP
ncbi:hypothetical protein RV06_GL000936 [Enterococcus haemoperoxidus]|nr:hypothetical protein RV06_GL000936 [Enterococcus haemoperoxidus]